MTINVEINLRIPRVKEPAKNADGYPINSADVRFIRELELPALPAPGAPIQLETRAGLPLACEVLRADWSEGKDRFIVYCRYAKRSIADDEYRALIDDPAWVMRPLL
jgi:hypothetical protein